MKILVIIFTLFLIFYLSGKWGKFCGREFEEWGIIPAAVGGFVIGYSLIKLCFLIIN